MVFISIGCNCGVKYQIDKHRHTIPTLFFDRLFTSMDAIINILGCQDIDKILSIDNIEKDINKPVQGNKSRICIKSVGYCVSIHDINIHYTHNDVLDFIAKYKRRFYRIIKYIKSEDKIYFIRDDKIDSSIQQKFIETILKINPSCNFLLVVIDNHMENKPVILKTDHCLYIKLNKERPVNANWCQDYLNWENVFVEIEKHIPTSTKVKCPLWVYNFVRL